MSSPRRRLPRALTIVAGALVAAAAAPQAAQAQTLPSVDVRTWRPSTDPRASLVLEPAATPPAWAWNAGVWLRYDHQPVSLRRASTGAVVYRPVEHLLGFDLTAGLGLGARAAVGVSLPVVLFQDGSDDMPPTVASTASVPTQAFGDLALHGKGVILPNEDGGFGLSALGAVTLPTGDRSSFAGDGSTRVTARLLAEYTLLLATAQASLGYTVRTAERTWPDASVGGVHVGGEIPWTVGVTVRPGIFFRKALDSGDRQLWEIAAHGWFPGGPVGPFGTGDPGSSQLTPVMLALSDRIALGHWRDTFALAGIDVGLTNALGVPAVRGVLAVGWAPREHDEDHDGVPDDLDQCKEIPEDKDGFEDTDGCPEIDDDDDGFIDKEDACPRVAGAASSDPKKNGCPQPDADGDGVPDTEDACPRDKGMRNDDKSKDGCPLGSGAPVREAAPAAAAPPEEPDRDGDGIDNAADQCPDVAEVYNAVKDDDGCPDEGGKPLVTVDPQTLAVRFTPPLPAGATPSVDVARALVLELNRKREWILGVAQRGASQDRALALIARVNEAAHRDVAEAVSWDLVKKQTPAGDLGFVILVPEKR